MNKPDFYKFMSNDKKLLKKVFKRPWAGTARKFNELCSPHGWRIEFLPRFKGAKSKIYVVTYNRNWHFSIPSVGEFLKMVKEIVNK